MSVTVTVIIPSKHGFVPEPSRSAIAAGLTIKKALDARLVVGVIGELESDSLASISYEGVDEVAAVQMPFEGFDSDFQLSASEALVVGTGASIVLFGHTLDATATAPALAARTGFGLATEISGLTAHDGRLSVQRRVFGGRISEEIAFTGKQVVLTVGAKAFSAPRATGPSLQVLDISPSLPQSRTTLLGSVEAEFLDKEIKHADLLIAVGRPIRGSENIGRAHRIAVALGGQLVSSRPAIDAGWVSPDRKVGQTGKTVRPKVYVALGISGAPQHLVGMSESGTVIAVNRDASAPILQQAAYTSDVDVLDLLAALESAVITGETKPNVVEAAV